MEEKSKVFQAGYDSGYVEGALASEKIYKQQIEDLTAEKDRLYRDAYDSGMADGKSEITDEIEELMDEMRRKHGGYLSAL